MSLHIQNSKLIIRQAEISDVIFLHKIWSNNIILKKYLFLVKHDSKQESGECINFMLNKFNNEMCDESLFKIMIFEEFLMIKKQSIGYLDLFIPYLKSSDTFVIVNIVSIDDAKRKEYEEVVFDYICNLTKDLFRNVKYLYFRNMINIPLPFRGETFFMGNKYYKYLLIK
jgi:hypothetical protein